MKWIFLSAALLPISAMPADRTSEMPEIRCLNDHTIPFIKSDTPSKEIVDNAYAQCKPELEEWMKLQESLPSEMKQRMRNELYSFYIRMIEIRRKSEANKSVETAH